MRDPAGLAQDQRVKHVMDRLAGVVMRLDVAVHETSGVSSAHQVLHALRLSEDGDQIEPSEATALVDALLPYVEAAGRQ